MRPNILWYCTDEQRFDTIEGLGNSHINTPRIDEFMQTATVFTHAFCQSPICSASRASFLSGMYPSAVGVNGNGYEHFPRHYQDRLITNVLAKAGYDCGLVGKLHLASAADRIENRVEDGYRSFNYSFSPKGPRLPGHEYAEWLRGQGADVDKLLVTQNPGNYRDGAGAKNFAGIFTPTKENDTIPPHLHQTHWCTQKGIEFIEKNRGAEQPWCLSVNPFDPHAPFDAPWEYFRRYDPASMPDAHFEEGDLAHQQRLVDAGVDFQSQPKHPDEWDQKRIYASYYAMIEHIDHEFGRLLDYLDETGQRENTIIIFMSDHGDMLCDHGLLLKGCRFYEGLVRVPLMISRPGHFQEGLVTDTLVQLLDIAPTLYDALGMEIPYHQQGQSLLPVLTGQSTHHRAFVRSEFYGGINFPDQTHATMIRDERWKLIVYHGKSIYELYDLETDPWEHNDLSNDPNHQAKKWEMVGKSFDATVYAHPPTPERIASF